MPLGLEHMLQTARAITYNNRAEHGNTLLCLLTGPLAERRCSRRVAAARAHDSHSKDTCARLATTSHPTAKGRNKDNKGRPMRAAATSITP